jgi:hypothetical protein
MPTCTDMLTGKRDIPFSDSPPGRGKGGAAFKHVMIMNSIVRLHMNSYLFEGEDEA